MPVSSLYPAVTIPSIDAYSFLFRRTDKAFSDEKVIYQDGDDNRRKYTFSDVHRASIEFATGLKAHYGLSKGDVVAMFTPNDIDTPPVTFGILETGATVTPANPGYTVPEFTYQLKDSGAKLVVAHASALDTVVKACVEAGLPESNILILGALRDPQNRFKHWNAIRAAPSKAQIQSSSAGLDPMNDVAFIAYSSGTTGKPKGVMITHRNIISNVLQISACEAGKLSSSGSKQIEGIPDAPPEGDKVLACLPFFHIYGLTSLMLAPIRNGIHTVVLAKFEIEKFCRLIQDLKITFVYIVPPMALLLAKHPNVSKYNLRSIRMTNSGAAPLSAEVQDAVFKRTGIRIKQGYGLSETSPTTHEQRWEDWNKSTGSVGRLQPNMEAKFCAVGAEDGPEGLPPKELSAGETGELYVKGPNVFKGYWKNPTATAECLSPDGWFRTGDVGHVDKNGDFYITDRVKELIKYKGFQVPPAELEGYLIDHELVDDVVVLGVDSEELGTEIPRAYIVRKGGMEAVRPGDDKVIIGWLAAKVANHKKLRGGIKFVDSIPKTASGKLLRRLLKDQARKEYAEIEQKRLKAKL